MFEKYGELTLEELNNTAKGLADEGDMESLKILAKENGLDPLDVVDYMDGITNTLASPMSAAMGRLSVEYNEALAKSKSAWEIMPLRTIYEMSKVMVTETGFALAAMTKGKRMQEILDTMKAEAQKGGDTSTCVCGTDKQLRSLIKTYYMGDVKKLEKEIKALMEG